ncbi:MAG: hypothetical protein H0V82_00795 [Candidatus Protochlamydia sp.]|nr:hypothetical protein [Candidatus Protochlamydia sp.]
MERSSKIKEIRRFAAVITCAVAVAFILTFISIYYYSPSKLYAAKNVLLRPEIIKEINLRDKHPQTGHYVQFVFDQTEFSFYVNGEQKRIALTEKTYAEFYHFTASQLSLENLQDGVKKLFNAPHFASLMTRFQAVAPSQIPASKIFQIVQLVPADYFRIQLHEGKGGGEWAYFYQAGIYQFALGIFTQHTKERA